MSFSNMIYQVYHLIYSVYPISNITFNFWKTCSNDYKQTLEIRYTWYFARKSWFNKSLVISNYLLIACFTFPCCIAGIHRYFSVKHCVKSVHICSHSGPYFPAFGLNTERYLVSPRIHPKCGKIRTRITQNTNTSHAVSFV